MCTTPLLNIDKLSTDELWSLYSGVIKKLKEKGQIRTKNITGERGEYLAIQFFNNTPGLPNLIATASGTANVDAISRNGERYSIKTIMSPNRTTGVLYGMGTKEKIDESQKFEYLLVVILNDFYELEEIIEIPWLIAIQNLSWHSRMNAYNLSVRKKLLETARIVYKNDRQNIKNQTQS